MRCAGSRGDQGEEVMAWLCSGVGQGSDHDCTGVEVPRQNPLRIRRVQVRSGRTNQSLQDHDPLLILKTHRWPHSKMRL